MVLFTFQSTWMWWIRPLFISEMETILQTLSHKNVVGFDVVETASDRLGDNTAVVAAKLIYDFLTLVE